MCVKEGRPNVMLKENSEKPKFINFFFFFSSSPAGQYRGQGRDEVMFSPTAAQTKDHYAQEYMNSLGRSRGSSRDPHSPPAQ